MKLQTEFNKVWESTEIFPTAAERTQRRWELIDRKENIQNFIEGETASDETPGKINYSLRYEIWK